ncbi:hypothetical protein IRJ41_015763, partial [Triplophysa rosa]
LAVTLSPRCFVVNVCEVYSWNLIKPKGFTVKGPSGPLVVPLGGSVLLPCSVDSLSSLEGLEVEWKRSDSQTLIHLYQDGDIRPDSQHEDYHDRAHFFTENIKQGNFSLLMKNVRQEDKGQYTCTVHSGQETGETVVEIKDVERLIVSGSDQSLSVYVGEDVTLNCSVDSHIPPEHIEEVSWKKRVKDEHITVLLYQNNETFPDSSDEQYRDRVEFFIDEIHRGNFSLRLKRVRTEDKGLYMCHVFAGRFSDNTTIVLQQMGFSSLHIMVLILCITACGSALLVCCLIYCRNNTEYTCQVNSEQRSVFSFSLNLKCIDDLSDSKFIVVYSCDVVVPLGSSVVLPCLTKKEPLPPEGLKVEWKRSGLESPVFVYEDGAEVQNEDYRDRAHFYTDDMKHENFSLLLKNLRKEDEGIYTCNVYRGTVFSRFVHSNLVQRLRDSGFRLQMFLAICPNIIMCFAFVFWGVSEGSVSETVCCCALYILRPLLLLWTAPYINDFKDRNKTLILKYSYVTDYFVLTAVVYPALFTNTWQKIQNFAEFDRVLVLILYGIIFVCCSCKAVYILEAEFGNRSKKVVKIFDIVADFTFEILPTLQFILLFYTFASARGVLVFVHGVYICSRSLWIIFRMILNILQTVISMVTTACWNIKTLCMSAMSLACLQNVVICKKLVNVLWANFIYSIRFQICLIGCIGGIEYVKLNTLTVITRKRALEDLMIRLPAVERESLMQSLLLLLRGKDRCLGEESREVRDANENYGAQKRANRKKALETTK